MCPDHRLLGTGGSPDAPGVDVEGIQAAGFPVVPFTVNDPRRMAELLDRGVRGMITDRPDLLLALLRAADRPEWPLLTEDGRVDRELFDLQGHRGAAHLRPGNSLPSMEAALDNLVTTIETDVRLSRDGALVLVHDARMTRSAYRPPAGGTPGQETEAAAEALTLAEIRARFVGDVMADAPPGAGDLAPSPVATAVAAARGLPHPHAVATLEDLVALVRAYTRHHAARAAHDPLSALRARNARCVHLNIEIKLDEAMRRSPRAGAPGPGAAIVRAVGREVAALGLGGRAEVMCFDVGTTLLLQRWCPELRPSYLFGLPPAPAAPRRPAGRPPAGPRAVRGHLREARVR